MHTCGVLTQYSPIFKGALHAYAETEATGVHREALFAVERDVEHEPDPGPASRGVPAHERDEVLRDKTNFVYVGYYHSVSMQHF